MSSGARLPSGHVWLPDKESDECMGAKCRVKFSLFTRKHHCRWCGKIYCDQCSPDPAPGKPRLCKDCRLPRVFTPQLLQRRLGRSFSQSDGLYEYDATPAELILAFVGVGKTRTALMQTCRYIRDHFHVPTLPYRAHTEERFPQLRHTGTVAGKGGGGVVHIVNDNLHRCLVAVKLVAKDEQWGFAAYRRLLQEIEFQRSAQHPNVAPLFEAFQTPDKICFSMRAGEGKSLRHAFENVKRMQCDMEVFALYIIREITKAIRYLFTEKRIVHRDLKPDNIVLSGDYDNVMLIDFGLAERIESDSQMYCPCGTKGFASPENIAAVNRGEAKFRATASEIHEGDVFSLGVVAFILVSGTRPFRQLGFREMQQQLLHGIQCTGSRWDAVSAPTKQLIEWMLHRNHERRATPDNILEHESMKNLDQRLEPLLNERRKRRTEMEAEVHAGFDLLLDLSELFAQETIKPGRPAGK
jgi:hypothetical protein